jgi:pimeloyl-ACP methyl ester carboxylesterase
MQKDRHNCWMLITLQFLLALAPLPAVGGIVTLQMEQGLVASADYLQGTIDAPAILILHGFLQTREFITVRRLADSLHELGHTILLPNLTLGISARKQSLSCEAIHTHSMEQDTREIARWVDWLQQQTSKQVVLIGHSTGSLQLVVYLSQHPEAPIAQSIFISLLPYGVGPASYETIADRLRAEQYRTLEPRSLKEYGLAYCKRYLTTAGNYLSYLSWDLKTTLDTLSRLRVPTTIILGGNDQRMHTDWREQLQTIGLQVITVAGANHFFDHEYEFDLLESIERLLE